MLLKSHVDFIRGKYNIYWDLLCCSSRKLSGHLVRLRYFSRRPHGMSDLIYLLQPTRNLCFLQFPAESMILQIDQSGAVVIEDRQNIAYAVPACYPTQLSTMLSYSVAPGNASFVATWTRCEPLCTHMHVYCKRLSPLCPASPGPSLYPSRSSARVILT